MKIQSLLLTIFLMVVSSNAQALRLQCYSSSVTVTTGGGSYEVDTSFCEWIYEDSDMPYYFNGYPYDPYDTGGSNTGGASTTTETLCGGNPVLLASGKKFQHESDFSIENDLLSITRSYYQTHSGSGLFGPKWLSNFEYSLDITRDNDGNPVAATLVRANGQSLLLYRNTQSGRWYELSGKFALFGESSSGIWSYKGDDGVTENYDEQGRITLRSSGAEQALFYRYTEDKLTEIVSITGRVLTLSYNEAGLLSQITTPDQRIFHYSYDENGLLAQVISPDETKRAYFYQDSRHPGALTSININDNVYAKWVYDEQGRALSSEHADGADKTLFTYHDNDSTTMTNPLGKQTTYLFTTINGKKLPTTIEGHESGVCYAANQSHSYDALGFKDKVTDWQGNVTDYDYNDRGFITKKTTAFGTPQAYSVATQWHGFLPLPLSITTNNLKTTFGYDDQQRLIEKKQQALLSDDVRVWSFQYDLHPNGKIKRKIANGPLPGALDVVTYTYDAQGNLLSKVNALDHKISYGDFDALGNVGYMIDINDIKTDYHYDANMMTAKMAKEGVAKG